jgi:hypothetical protein
MMDFEKHVADKGHEAACKELGDIMTALERKLK